MGAVSDASWPGGLNLFLTVLNLVVFVAAIALLSRTMALASRYRMLMKGPGGTDLDAILRRNATELERQGGRVAALEEAHAVVRRQVARCMQRVGVVRFNAFDDTGSNLSFSVAILDEAGDGLALTSLFGRDQSRTYAKPVQDWKSSYVLTGEEMEAIGQARRASPPPEK
jgi:hypothetical protein